MLKAVTSKEVVYFVDEELVDQGFLLAFSTRSDGIASRTLSAFKLASLLGIKRERLTFAEQVHGTRTILVGPAQVGAGSIPTIPPIPAVDALVTDTVGVPLVVLTADCVPILLVDAQAKVVAVVHAGWRGTLARISARAVEVMVGAGAEPGRIQARLGPHIGSCCYEVDQELLERFTAQFQPVHPRTPRPSLNLGAINEDILVESGVHPEGIESVGLCTACRDDLFFSWRRSRDTGRLASIAAVL